MSAHPVRVKPLWLAGGVVFVLACSLLALMIGPTGISPWGVLVESFDRLTPGSIDSGLSRTERSIVWNLRLPRVALGLCVGAALATSGATFQGVFRNPLADPYLLGVAAGGGLGATLGFVYGWGDGLGLFDGVQVAAFIGCLVSVALTWTMGALSDRTRSTTSLILAGVAVASFFTAVQTYFQQRDTEDIRQIYNWFLGGLTTSGWDDTLQIVPVLTVCLVVLMLAGRPLDVLSVGDEEAQMLGFKVGQVRVVLVVFGALLTASAVAVSGLIAFVGLIVPHAVRLVFGSSFKVVLPLSMLFGAGFLALCDLAARTVLSPAEVPIGVITAFFGAPFFVFILRTAAHR